MKILKPTDIVTLKHNELEVDFSPLRYDQALEVANTNTFNAGNSIIDIGAQTALLVKYAVKEVRGLTDFDNSPITIKAVNNQLSEDEVTMAINALSRTPFLAPISFISASSNLKKFKGVEVVVNGKVVDLGND